VVRAEGFEPPTF